MQIEEAIDVIKNEIDDFVIGDYCVEICEQKELCKDGECRFSIAIDTLITYVETMHSELDRLEGIEDNTAMLMQELTEQKVANNELNGVLIHFKAVINEMAKYINNEESGNIYDLVCTRECENEKCRMSEGDNKYQELDCIKEYFYKKVQK